MYTFELINFIPFQIVRFVGRRRIYNGLCVIEQVTAKIILNLQMGNEIYQSIWGLGVD